MTRVTEPPCFGGSGNFFKRAAPAPGKKRFLGGSSFTLNAMVSAKIMIPVQTGISGIFSNTIKCKLNLKTGTLQFEKPEVNTIFKLKMSSL